MKMVSLETKLYENMI